MKSFLEFLIWVLITTALLSFYNLCLDQKGLLVFTHAFSLASAAFIVASSFCKYVNSSSINGNSVVLAPRKLFLSMARSFAVYSFILCVLGFAAPMPTWQPSPFYGVDNDPWAGISVIAGIIMAIVVASSSVLPFFSDPVNE